MSEAVARRCSVKKTLLKISQSSRENTCARISFLKCCERNAEHVIRAKTKIEGIYKRGARKRGDTHLGEVSLSSLTFLSELIVNLRVETFCSLLVSFCLLLVSFCSLLFTFCSSLVTFCSLLVIFSSLLFACCSCLLLLTRCSTRNSEGFF